MAAGARALYSAFPGPGAPGRLLGLFRSSRLATATRDPAGGPVRLSPRPSHAAHRLPPCFRTLRSTSSASDLYFLRATSQAVFLEMLLRDRRIWLWITTCFPTQKLFLSLWIYLSHLDT